MIFPDLKESKIDLILAVKTLYRMHFPKLRALVIFDYWIPAKDQVMWAKKKLKTFIQKE